jgi:hypothetical protein
METNTPEEEPILTEEEKQRREIERIMERNRRTTEKNPPMGDGEVHFG